MFDNLSADVKIITFSPTEDKIQIMAIIPEDKKKEIKERFKELKSWNIINSDGQRLDLESTLPIREYNILINPLGRTDREYEMGDKSGNMAFWLNAKDGPPVHSFGNNLKCYGKNKAGEETLPCFELRNSKMQCNFHDKFTDEFDGEPIEMGEASIICWTNQE